MTEKYIKDLNTNENPSLTGYTIYEDGLTTSKVYIDKIKTLVNTNPILTGNVNMSGATSVTVPTVSADDIIGEKAANTYYVNAAINRESVLKGTLTNINLTTYKSNLDGLYDVIDATFFNGETKFLFLQQIVGDEKTYQYVVSVTGKKYERFFGLDEEVTTPWSTITLNSPTFTGDVNMSGATSVTAPKVSNNTNNNTVITANWIMKPGDNIVIGSGNQFPETYISGVTYGNNLYGNVCIGYDCGRLLTTGTQNLFLGYISGRDTTIGNTNTAVGGVGALMYNISGSTNTAIGTNALRYLRWGSSNVGIGENAGSLTPTYWGQGLNYDQRNVDNSIFIGAHSKGKNFSGDTNTIVIGYNAQGQGSNTVTLGNDFITDTYLKGFIHNSVNISKQRNNYVLNNPGQFTNILDITNIVFSSSNLNNSVELILTNGASKNNLLSVGDSFKADFVIDGVTTQNVVFQISNITGIDELSVYNPYFQEGNNSTDVSMIVIEYNKIGYKTLISTTDLVQEVNLNVQPKYTNIFSLGSANNAWKDIYALDTSINTSDERKKTSITLFTQNELNASKQLSKEIGTYQWLSAVKEKGDSARKHIGMTVQRAIEIMTNNNLNPFDYGFICYDEWEDEFKTIPAIEYKEAWTEEIKDVDGTIVKIIEHPEIEAVPEKQIQTKWAGNVYSFRYTELLAFIARGFEERLSALENK